MGLLPGHLSEEDGFLDVSLPIERLEAIATGGFVVIARGSIDGVEMGFAVTLDRAWSARPLEDGSATFYWGTGSYRCTGIESDRFVAFLASKYGLPAAGLTMVQEVKTEVVGLDADPQHTATDGMRTKFFFHSSDEGRYAEVFTNVNLQENVLEFHEKDNEYRHNLLRALTET